MQVYFALVSASGKTQVATTVVAPKWHNSGGSKKPAYLLAKAVVFFYLLKGFRS